MNEMDELDKLFAQYDGQEEVLMAINADKDDEIDDLFELLTSTVEQEATLKDKTIVVTGKLQNYTRRQVQAVIEERGGHSPNSVTLNTVALVVGDKPGMTKLRRAVELGLPILDENQFMQMARGLR